MNSKVCPNCNFENEVSSLYCSRCGYPLESPESQVYDEDTTPTSIFAGYKICSGCKAKNSSSAKYCHRCGLLLPIELLAEESVGTPAGFIIRLAAYIIDNVVLSILILLIIITFTDITASQINADIVSDPRYTSLTIASAIIYISYFTYCIGRWGQTAGKAVMGIKVFRSNGSPLTYHRSLLRAVLHYLSSLLLGFLFLTIALRQDKKAIHDLICDTRVLKIRK